MKQLAQFSHGLLEKDLLPDPLIRFGIRGLLKEKLRQEKQGGIKAAQKRMDEIIREMKVSDIAVNTSEANDQHYEVPTEFFQLVMGRHMKYSCGYWNKGVTDFDQTELDMLKLTAKRAELTDGQRIIELGCGWGSMTLFMAETFPKSQITGVSNSATQKIYIEEQAKSRGLKNIRIITSDMNDFDIDEKFDRVVSIEMFEHMRNYQKLLKKISSWMKPEGKIFIHIFTHIEHAYFYQLNQGFDWMARYFFTGGIMPSDNLLYNFQDDFEIVEHWKVNGSHYEKTSNGWLHNMDQNREKVIPILKGTYGADYKKWWVYWRVFFMACAELWGYDNGNEWIVSHYLMRKK